MITDRDLVSEIKAGNDHLKIDLWNRYEKLVHKNWHILDEQMNRSQLVRNLQEDYYSEAYIAFEKALEAIDLSIIRDDNWKFLGYFRLYLKNVRTALIEQILRKADHETSFYIETEDGSVPKIDLSPLLQEGNYMSNPETAFDFHQGEERSRAAIRECVSRWNPRQLQIFSMLRKGYLKQDIAETLDISAPTVTYYVNRMREELEKEMGIYRESFEEE